MFEINNLSQTSSEGTSNSVKLYTYYSRVDNADVIMAAGYFPAISQTASYTAPSVFTTGDRVSIHDSAGNRFVVCVKLVNGVVTLVPFKTEILEIDVYKAQLGRGIYSQVIPGFLWQIDAVRNGSMTAGNNTIAIYKGPGINTLLAGFITTSGDSGVYQNLTITPGITRIFIPTFSNLSISNNDFVNVTSQASGTGTYEIKVNLHMIPFS